jgi:hypothetical protein
MNWRSGAPLASFRSRPFTPTTPEMRQRVPKRDPRGTHRRKVVAARRTGVNAACSCGERRPEALIPGKPITCANCQRIAGGRTTVDQHHFAGRANSPATLPVPVNDHRARLSVAQADWPKSTLVNAEGSPLLAAAAASGGSSTLFSTSLKKACSGSRTCSKSSMRFRLSGSGRDGGLGRKYSSLRRGRNPMAVDHEISTLPVAVRVFPDSAAERDSRSAKFWRWPHGMVVIHTQEVRRGFIGIYRFIVDGECVEEGVFYHLLPRTDIHKLEEYVASHRAETHPEDFKRLRLLNRHEFLQVFYELAYKARCLVVGFNLPIHLARLAFTSAPARGFFAGGFSFTLWTYKDKKGCERPNGFRPRICIKYIDRKRSLIAFTARNSPDPEDLIPEGSLSGEPKPGYRFRGHFLDLRTLSFALANEVFSLEAACQAFGVTNGKKSIEAKGDHRSTHR